MFAFNVNAAYIAVSSAWLAVLAVPLSGGRTWVVWGHVVAFVAGWMTAAPSRVILPSEGVEMVMDDPSVYVRRSHCRRRGGRDPAVHVCCRGKCVFRSVECSVDGASLKAMVVASVPWEAGARVPGFSGSELVIPQPMLWQALFKAAVRAGMVSVCERVACCWFLMM